MDAVNRFGSTRRFASRTQPGYLLALQLHLCREGIDLSAQLGDLCPQLRLLVTELLQIVHREYLSNPWVAPAWRTVLDGEKIVGLGSGCRVM